MLSSVFFSACSLNSLLNTEVKTDTPNNTQVTPSSTPTISQDNSMDTIEAELKATTIVEEDFSDLDD